MDPHTRLIRAVHALTGTDAPVTGIRPVTAGTKKAVLRLHLGQDPLIAYLWHPDLDHWKNPHTDPSDPFSHDSGADLFHTAHTLLAELGLPVPDLYALDTSRTHHRAHIALLQDLGTTTLEDLLHHHPESAHRALQHLRAQLHTLHTHTRTGFGRPAQPAKENPPAHPTCHSAVLQRALTHLEQATHLEPRLVAHHARLAELLHTRARAVQPRTRHGLVHGELGPDHVLVTDEGTPHLIDIEGLMFFDTEWEHAFLRLRFGRHYPHLATAGLDPARTRLYTLALHLSLVAGPLDLLSRPNCPEPEQMRAIAEANLARALAAT